MGIEPFLIAYAINLIVAQRLIRTLCSTCKHPEPDPDPVLLHALGFTDEEIAATTFYTTRSMSTCPECNGLGYKGRRAISEALHFTREIRHMIVEAGDSIDEDSIRTTAIEQGMLTLLASGREIVKRGQTTIEELMRVVASDM
jgi:type IV pilus assembly protein PilB